MMFFQVQAVPLHILLQKKLLAEKLRGLQLSECQNIPADSEFEENFPCEK